LRGGVAPRTFLAMLIAVTVLVLAAHRSLLSTLASLWAYVLLGASVIVVEEVAPVLAGFAAHQNHLPIGRAALVCAMGGWVATLLPYALGRWGATALLRRWPAAAAGAQRLTGVVGRRPWRASLASRFIFGARTLLPLACGTARVRPIIFLIGTAISALVWAVLFTALGWGFGETALLVIGRVRRHEDLIALGLVIVVVIIVIFVQRRNRPHVVEEIEG
jgi:membrane protein DedA with SNARE-associated domain